ncbi:right-handed parallel beta-helix repeat-containing protein [Nocardioides sp. LHD-245]|uniref:right-handed parallel beta-helix repeat-containing protein n=1 Tax=Nocardioides sp. LHD-245 TaxID=3051387 RepID=UPI0027DEC456|nr:right-handed parallel beta-helix repeat-containing protein [Nocardioides sp. LHD-245]
MSAVRPAATLLAVLLGATWLGGCSSADEDPEPAAPAAERSEVVRVPEDAPTLGEALESVAEDGLVLVGPGTYPEQVLVEVPGVTIRGTDRNAVVITGEGRRTSGIVVIADGVTVENLTVTSTTLYGVLFTGVHEGRDVLTPGQDGYESFDPERFPPLERFRIDHVTATNNGLYGIYAFNTRHGMIVDSWASGSADSGIYVGQCRECDTVVAGNVTARNAVGFENANASDSLSIVGNRFSDNRVGMTLTSNYQEAFVPQRGNLVAGNVITDNSEARSPTQADGGWGIGIGVGGGQDNRLVRNLVAGNPRAGVLLDSVEDVPSTGNTLEGNAFRGNGVDLANTSDALAPATGNCVADAAGLSLLPLDLLDRCGAGDQPAATGADLPGGQAPAGMSFLEVPLPGELPSLDATDDVPVPLPATIIHPDLGTITVPPASLLADVGRG